MLAGGQGGTGDEDAAVQQPVQLQAADASSLQVKASRKAEQVVPLMPHGLMQGSPWQRRSASATEATRRPMIASGAPGRVSATTQQVYGIS